MKSQSRTKIREQSSQLVFFFFFFTEIGNLHLKTRLDKKTRKNGRVKKKKILVGKPEECSSLISIDTNHANNVTKPDTKSENKTQALSSLMETATRCLAKQEPWYDEDATNGDG